MLYHKKKIASEWKIHPQTLTFHLRDRDVLVLVMSFGGCGVSGSHWEVRKLTGSVREPFRSLRKQHALQRSEKKH